MGQTIVGTSLRVDHVRHFRVAILLVELKMRQS